MAAALAALLAPAASAEAKKKPPQPTVSSVRPLQARVGDTITVYGKNFIKGKARNTVVFKTAGAKAVFVKADVSTLTQIRVVLPDTLTPFLRTKDGAPTYTLFQVRVLARRFGKAYTPEAKSPLIGPAIPKGTVAPGGTGTTTTGTTTGTTTPATPVNNDCDDDGILNKDETDDDNDLIADDLEAKIGTDPCKADSDADGVPDGYEYKSAIDLNDDEYQQPNSSLPYPGGRPYPNPLDASDASKDWDGDFLTLEQEYELWKYTWSVAKTSTYTLAPLSYSDGMQYSVSAVCHAPNPEGSPCGEGNYNDGRRYPTLKAAGYSKFFGPGGFLEWVRNSGYERVVLGWDPPYSDGTEYSIFDSNRSGNLTDFGVQTPGFPDYPDSEGSEYQHAEIYPLSLDGAAYLSDELRDEDADGLTNYDELGGRMLPGYWSSCYKDENPFKGGYDEQPLSPTNADSDGDGIRDGADDQDHDDLPNLMEMSRVAASGFDDTENGSIPPEVPAGEDPPPPNVGIPGPAMNTCVPDKELPPKDKPWHQDDPPYGRVNPFNPCLPVASRTCPRASQFGDTPAGMGEAVVHWVSLN